MVREILPIATERLLLRRFERGDLPIFVAYRNDPQIAKYQSWTSYSMSEASKFFEQQSKLAFNMNETWFQIAMSRQSDDQLIGDVAVRFYDRGRSAEIGFTVAAAAQNCGFATEAVAAVVRMLFLSLAKDRLSAIVDSRNHAGVKLLGKTGFHQSDVRAGILFKGEKITEYEFTQIRPV
ncbi:MAG: GNAT family N-acetyltransferase [Parvularculaceae bacterium]